MAETTFKVGDKVTDFVDNSFFYMVQGEVSGIFDDGRLFVHFPPFTFPDYFFDNLEPVDCFQVYEPADFKYLRKDVDWEFGNYSRHIAQELFGKENVNAIYMHEVLTEGRKCAVEHCESLARVEAYVMVKGTVYITALCRKHHHQWHGQTVNDESLRFKQTDAEKRVCEQTDRWLSEHCSDLCRNC